MSALQVEAIDKAGCDWIHIDVMVCPAPFRPSPVDTDPKLPNGAPVRLPFPGAHSPQTWIVQGEQGVVLNVSLLIESMLDSYSQNYEVPPGSLHVAPSLGTDGCAEGRCAREQDGRFVPNITIGPLIVDALRPVTDLPLDVHLVRALRPGLWYIACSESLQNPGIIRG